MGLNLSVMRVGNDNLFQSYVFSSTISNLVGAKIEVIETTGAVGAAKAAGVVTGLFATLEEAMAGGNIVREYLPETSTEEHLAAYQLWERDLEKLIN